MVNTVEELEQTLLSIRCNPLDTSLTDFRLKKDTSGKAFIIPVVAYVFAQNVKTANGDFSQLKVYDGEDESYSCAFNGHFTYDEAKDVEEVKNGGYFIKVTPACVIELYKLEKKTVPQLIPLGQ